MSNHPPLIVGTTPLVGEITRPQTLLNQPVRTAVELRLDIGDAWQRVLDDPQWFADQVDWVTDDISDVTPPPLVIGTCRREQDGGRYDGDEQTRLDVLLQAARFCDFIDVEAGVQIDWPPDRIIRSFHDFEGMPPDLKALTEELRSQGGAIVKIVGTARRLSDNLKVREFLKGARNVACFLMGERGVPSRILGMAWGSTLSYASLTAGEIAPGMVDFGRMVNLYRAAEIDTDWECFGVTGRHVAHSLSPAIHNVALSQAGQNRVYLPLAAADAEDFLEFADALPVSGASVTVPYKEDLAKACAKLDEAAEQTGAVNTLVRIPEGWRGKNTDVPAFSDDMIEKYARPIWGRSALVLGAGGSARAVVHALRTEGADVYVWARRPEQAEALVKDIGGTAVAAPADVRQPVDLLVNTTPCGMTGPHAGEIAVEWSDLKPLLAHDALVYDLVYEPDETPLLEAAAADGFAVHNGLEMLRRQAALQALAFGYRLGVTPPEPPKFQRHVWLVGYRGAGKTAVARELAILLRRRAVDIDAQIELRAASNIRAIFAEKGEDEFRKLEVAALAKAASGKPDAVISAGGGAVESEENLKAMRATGLVVYLDAPEELLIERLGQDNARPALTDKSLEDEVSEVLARRKPLYQRAAHLTFAATEKSAREQAGAIAERLAQFKSR